MHTWSPNWESLNGMILCAFLRCLKGSRGHISFEYVTETKGRGMYGCYE
jgi:hypothetical protein